MTRRKDNPVPIEKRKSRTSRYGLDLMGMRFGLLTVTKQLGTIGKRSWECLCECGKTRVFAHSSLLVYGISSCGCKGSGRLVGQRRGMLLVLKTITHSGTGKKGYLCRCDCGKEMEQLEHKIKNGRVKSCGCGPHKERPKRLPPKSAVINKKYSDYRGNASQRGIPFNISHEQFSVLVDAPCYYCAVVPEYCSGVDRKNNDVGYEIENIVPCCSVCNMKKNVTHHDDFLLWIKKIHDNLGLGK